VGLLEADEMMQVLLDVEGPRTDLEQHLSCLNPEPVTDERGRESDDQFRG
jgi:hypothetical protein